MKTKKSFISTFILMLLFMFSIIKGSLYHIYYMMDKDGFVEYFCINKDKKSLHCEGKCTLKEVYNPQGNSSNDSVYNGFDFTQFQKDFVLISTNLFQWNIENPLKNQHSFYYTLPKWKNIFYKLSHPPV